MTFHRFVYKVCWRNQVTLPLLLLVCTGLLVVFLLPGTSVEYKSDGRIRLKYQPKFAGSHDSGGVVQDSLAIAGEVQRKVKAFDSPRTVGDDPGEVNLIWDENHLKIDEDNDLFKPRVKHGADKAWEDIEPLIEKSQVGASPNFDADLKLKALNPGLYSKEDLEELRKKADSQRLLREEENKVKGYKDPSGAQEKYPQDPQIQLTGRQYSVKRKHKSRLKFKPNWKTSVYYNSSNPPELFKTWHIYEEIFCSGDFVGYFNEFAILRDVIIDMDYCSSPRKGGEKIDTVMNQSEDSEYYTYDLGCFQQACRKRPSYYFNNNNHMNDWLYSLKTQNVRYKDIEVVHKEFVIAIVRYEYVNFYHTMSDWYNAFLLMQFFNKTQWDTNIILFDAHPQGSIDSTWLVLFNTTRRFSMLPRRTLFTNMVWNMLGYNSPLLDHYGPGMPLIEEFRTFFLSSYASPDDHKLDCGHLNIMFIWRRDYVAHPRNPKGTISRKIKNERELMKSVQEKYPGYSVRGVQIDIFEMQKQLALVSTTDILIGMHGAGLTHALFLPKHAGVIEMIPNYWSAANDHFFAIAQWRNLLYERWVNDDPHNEVPDNYTNVPLGVIHALLKNVIKAMCYTNGTRSDS